MNKKIVTVMLLMILVNSMQDLIAQQNILTRQEIAEGWKLLFDGKTTDGWRGFKMDKMPVNWSVADGCLTARGTGGGETANDIITVDQYEDFDLYLEWAIAPAGNSGIMFHVLEAGYPSTYATGPEYQLIDDAGWPGGLEEWQQAGANYAMHNADRSKKKLMPAGEFNSSRIKCENGHVTHWLNGEIIVEYDLWTDEWFKLAHEGKWKDYPGYGLARKGYIGLQDHGSNVRFRNIKIKDLTDKGLALFNGIDLTGWVNHGEEKWYVEDGMLVGASGSQGGYGYLATDKDYYNFILRVQFRLEEDGNSGVFFRSKLNGTDIKGWQAEVAPPGNNTGAIYESGGRGWLNEIPDDRENILKPDEWNDMVILLKDDKVMTWLNGELMTNLTDETIAEGRGVIALQVHSGGSVAVKWKNIFIKPMTINDNK
jgi:hypothetical protein